MRRIVERVAAAVLATAVVWGGISMYRSYTTERVYQEGVANLESTYGQMSQTFRLFTQRNWNVLSSYDSLIRYAKDDDHDKHWRDFIAKQGNWQYSKFYLFNEESDYLTEVGKQGRSPQLDAVFTEMYKKKKPIISSYFKTSGDRRVVFAIPLEAPYVRNDVAYTGMAVSYSNEAVENLVSGKVYNGEADSYVVDSHGRVILSLAPKSEIKEYIPNFLDFLEEDGNTIRHGSAADMRRDLGELRGGNLFLTRNGEHFYVIHEPLGINDWSIVGVVSDHVVNSGLEKIQKFTVAAMFALSTLLGILLVVLLVREGQQRIRREKAEKKELEEKNDLLNELYVAMQRITERIAVVNFRTGKYVYREQQLHDGLYPLEGEYKDLVKSISDRYFAAGDAEHMKISHILAPSHLREMLPDKDSVYKFEYVSRQKNLYKLMSILPVSWGDDGNLDRAILIGVDIGEKRALENMANTDGLTGLFNERYFEMVLSAKEERKQPFLLFYLDLDRFKPINDTYGHTAGDYVLEETAKRLLSCIRSDDYAFRIGGDEFTLLISTDYNPDMQTRIEERLRKAINAPFCVDGHELSVGCSIGAAFYPKEAPDAAHTRILADQRMYECKERNHGER